MKRSLIIALFLFLGFSSSIQAQTYNWVHGGGSNSDADATGNEHDQVMSICTDPNGNIYQLSRIGQMGSLYMDGTFLTSGYGGISEQHVLFASYTCNGTVRFAKYISGAEIYAQGLTTDNFGHVYLALGGHYATGSYTLHIGSDTTITGTLLNMETIVQYDTSGHLNWLRFVGLNPSTGGIGGQHNNYLTLDGSENPHFIIVAYAGLIFRPGDTSQYGFTDLKYDPSGNLLTVKHIMLDTTLAINDLSIDKVTGKMYVTGSRSAAYPGYSPHSFIAGFDTARSLIWKDTASNPIFPTAGFFGGIESDHIGHLYVSFITPRKGIYKGDTIENQYMFTTGSKSVFGVMKLDTIGNIKWVRKYSCNYSAGMANSLIRMANNKLAISGVIVGGQVIGGTDTLNIYPGEGQNPIYSILDSGGYVHTIQQLHGLGFYDNALNLASDKVGNLYIGGQIQTNIWAGSLSPYVWGGGYSDFYIMKYGVNCSCTSMPVANYTYTGTDLTRSFTYTGTATGIDSVRWTFGDGGISSLTNPTHTYTSAGTFTVCVRVYSSCGNDMRCHEVTVSCATTPIANFVDTGVFVHGFTYTGTTAGYDSVVWNFGDGSFDTGLHVLHTYAVADTYHVCAKVYTNCGTDTFCKDVYVGVVGFVQQMSFTDIKVFPNPATNELYITNAPQNGNYRLLNIVGVMQMQGVLQKGNTIVSILQIPPGIYLLEMTGNDGMKNVVRIIKQ